MTDDEMRAMPIPALQDEGLLFLWVTGRAMEVGRECMRVWGYVSPGQKIVNYSLILILIGTLAWTKSYGSKPTRYSEWSMFPAHMSELVGAVTSSNVSSEPAVPATG